MRLNRHQLLICALFACTPDVGLAVDSGVLYAMAPPTSETVLTDSISAARVKQLNDSVRTLHAGIRTAIRNTQTCKTAACLAAQRALLFRADSILNRVDSLLAAGLQPVPVPPPDTQPTPPVDSQPPVPPDTGSTPAPSDTTVQLPRVTPVYVAPVTSRTITVTAGMNLQAAFDSARYGDAVCMPAGTVWSGNFYVRPRAGSGELVIRACDLSPLPPIGTRVALADTVKMPRIVSTNNMAALHVMASRVTIIGVEVTATMTLPNVNYGILRLGGYSDEQTTFAQMPQNMALDRVIVRGQPNTNTQRCVALNTGTAVIVSSYLDHCHAKGFDSQAIGTTNGAGPFLIENNYLAGAGENVMIGGGAPGIPGLVTSDVTIRRNYIHTPIAWRGDGVNTPWTKKNLFELKNAQRVLVEANVLDGSWTDGQTGEAIVLKSSNDGGCTWCRTADVTIRRNLVRNAGEAVDLIRGDQYFGTVDSALRRVRIVENVFDNIHVAPYLGSARGFSINKDIRAVTFERNVLAGNLQAMVSVGDGLPDSSTDCTFRDNVLAHGEYGAFATGGAMGTAALNKLCRPGWVWAGMTLVGSGQSWQYPTGTTFVSSEQSAALAASIRSLVGAAVAGVVVPPR